MSKQEIAGLTKLSKEHNLPLDQVIKEYKEYHALLDNLQEQINQQRKLFKSIIQNNYQS